VEGETVSIAEGLRHAPYRRHAALVVGLTVVFLAVWESPPSHVFEGLSSYLPLHTILETFAVAVAALIFGLGWHTYSSGKPIQIVVLGSAFLAVALLDVGHFMSYQGMPAFITPSGPEKAIDFWLAARLVAAAALLTAATVPWRASRIVGLRWWSLAAALAVAGLGYGLILYRQAALPATFIVGEGLTRFKVGFEYVLIAMHALAVLAFAMKLRTRQPFDVATLLSVACIMILSELCFTLYSGVTDVFNLLGHVYKVIAYGLLYKAMFVDGVREPYRQLAQAQRNAWEEKERAEVTLHSIGDAVITTDITGQVQQINPAAEQLTGWAWQEAQGRKLEEVFHIVCEDTGQPVENPARRAMEEGIVVGLANHTVLISRLGERYAIEDSAAPIRDREGNLLGCVLVFHDVTAQRRLQNELSWQATHDALTGLPNRLLFVDRLERAVAHSRRHAGLVALCYMDLDQFKPINDQYGHEVGDQVLIATAARLRAALREEDTVARLGGDEFVVLLPDVNNSDEVNTVLARVQEAIAEPLEFKGGIAHPAASIGVTIYPFDDSDADTLLRHADQAMYTAKQSGRNRVCIFDPEQGKRLEVRRQDTERIRKALANRELVLHYQPKVNMRQGKVVGVEALLRWQHPERGLVPPLEFLPLIEQSDLIVDVGEWVLQEALGQMEAWHSQGLDFSVSINIAARQLQRADFVERLQRCLAQHPNLPPDRLELEILESAALEDMGHARTVIRASRELGVRFALDDFGTGYSSLAYLKHLPADTVKIDRSFVRDILDDPDDLALTEAVISLAEVFRRTVVAEGVESVEHGLLLMRLGCDLAQGYGIARPMPGDAVANWIAGFRPDPRWGLWGGVRWSLSDMPLLIAQYDHLKWVKQVSESLDGAPLRLRRDELVDPHRCRFGQWYDGPGHERYGRLPEFAAIDPVHQEVHRLGHGITELMASGNVDEARVLVGRLLANKDRILELLLSLQDAVAAEARPIAATGTWRER
jgi:diguanylate cyclase (GGDEF)-like protein/PAS domain S-box-containing protein